MYLKKSYFYFSPPALLTCLGINVLSTHCADVRSPGGLICCVCLHRCRVGCQPSHHTPTNVCIPSRRHLNVMPKPQPRSSMLQSGSIPMRFKVDCVQKRLYPSSSHLHSYPTSSHLHSYPSPPTLIPHPPTSALIPHLPPPLLSLSSHLHSYPSSPTSTLIPHPPTSTLIPHLPPPLLSLTSHLHSYPSPPTSTLIPHLPPPLLSLTSHLHSYPSPPTSTLIPHPPTSTLIPLHLSLILPSPLLCHFHLHSYPSSSNLHSYPSPLFHPSTSPHCM